jgi:hypothetical protein
MDKAIASVELHSTGMRSQSIPLGIAFPFEMLAVALIAYEQLTQDRQE